MKVKYCFIYLLYLILSGPCQAEEKNIWFGSYEGSSRACEGMKFEISAKYDDQDSCAAEYSIIENTKTDFTISLPKSKCRSSGQVINITKNSGKIFKDGSFINGNDSAWVLYYPDMQQLKANNMVAACVFYRRGQS